MSARSWLRAGLVTLAATQGLVGAVQLLWPRVFFDEFPTAGHPWVSLIPPYSEHLMRDVGALTLANCLVLAVAAVSLDRLLVPTALAANLAFTVPHFVFHASHLTGFPTGDAVSQTISLGIGVLLPAALLVLGGRVTGGRTRRETDQPGRPPHGRDAGAGAAGDEMGGQKIS